MAAFSGSVLIYIGLALYLATVVYSIFKFARRTITRRNLRRDLSQQYQCQPIQTKFPHKDPILGLDLFISNARAAWQHQFLETVNRRHDEIGETYQLNMLGTVGIMTRDPEIIKTVLSTHFKDYSLDAERKKALKPLLGNGIFATDGQVWAHSRAVLRPQFTRAQLMDLSMLEKHVGRLIDLVPHNGEEIELQELMLRFTMDMATDFLFGESTDGLLAGREGPYGQGTLQGFAESVQYAQHRMAMHVALGWWALLKPDLQFRHHVRVVHDFIDGFVQKELREHRPGVKHKTYVLLQALVEDVKDPMQIRDELVNILIAGRDTTASLISNVFFVLSRRPDIWRKLREEVRQHFEGKLPRFDQIPQCKYVRYTINESLRLFPPVPVNSRVAVCDTVISRGGGADGHAPVLITQGTPIVYNISGLHRREDVYGADAEEFKPERWEALRVGWQFLPFSGGPRVCIGQQFAITEASYVLIRFLQTFESVECVDETPWQEKISLTVSSLNGVRVRFRRAL
ncbi:cytochrome P450 [Coniochaeta ligniaria NRRL 30616]|uniref:Cytochrome P450 n=1 Tax=Coniochaeta ligniaria NRRL 30616 TaxID=1408157 RepID=A0A1J7JF28_9PEZI|nr:cytochrome P450 [Coniochaeta ligniaria NRRL 30616]